MLVCSPLVVRRGCCSPFRFYLYLYEFSLTSCALLVSRQKSVQRRRERALATECRREEKWFRSPPR